LLKALHLFGYGGLVLSIGASLSAMFLLDLLAEVPEQSWRLSQQPELELDKEHSDFDLLKSYGGSSGMSNVYTHCHISLIAGAYCLLLHIALLVWLNSDSVVIFVLVIVCLFWVCLLYPGHIVFAFFRGFFRGIMNGR
jgi:Flp pilus assembly protein TadB